MTVEPASTRANRINSDSLDWSYIGISLRLGIRRARGVRGPRQCLGVDVFPDLRHLAVLNGDGEDPVVPERPIRGFDFPRSDADDQNPVSLRDEFRGLWVCRFHLDGSLPKHFRQSRVPAGRAGQRPVLTWNDPLNIFGNQREQTLLVAAADRCKKILHNLDILSSAHKNFSIPRIGSCPINSMVRPVRQELW